MRASISIALLPYMPIRIMHDQSTMCPIHPIAWLTTVSDASMDDDDDRTWNPVDGLMMRQLNFGQPAVHHSLWLQMISA